MARQRLLARVSAFYQKYPILSALVLLVPYGGPVDAFLSRQKITPIFPTDTNPDLRALIDASAQFDGQTLTSIRTDRGTSIESVYQLYQTLIRGALVRVKETNPDVLGCIRHVEVASRIVRSGLGDIGLGLSVQKFHMDSASDVPKIDLIFERFGSGKRNAYIQDVSVIWPCACYSGPRSICPIHKHPDADALSSSFANEIVEIDYDGVSVFWRESDYFWPPSIDSICLLEDVRASGLLKKPIYSVADIGAGTGFLGIFLAKKNPSVSKLYLTDWLLTPAIFSSINAAANLNDRHVQRFIGVGMDYELIEGCIDTRVGLVICNPPYLPTFGKFFDSAVQSTVFGTDLLQAIVIGLSCYADRLVISLSEIAFPELEAAIEQTGARTLPLGPLRTVPFRVPQALDDKDYIEHLKVEGRAIQEREGSQHRYWHRIQSFLVESHSVDNSDSWERDILELRS